MRVGRSGSGTDERIAGVGGQCHVEYYCSSKMPLPVPGGNGLWVDAAEKYWDEAKFADGTAFVDYTHKETKAPILKAQHPEFELWGQGVHARAGVSCSDCHMPYIRQGASKVSDHWVRSPLLNINRACQSCHRASESELAARVDSIQSKNFELLQRGGDAIVDLIDGILDARKAGASEGALEPAKLLQRRAQWRLDFIAAENSMGFHAPQEAARVLGEATDYARQGQVAALEARMGLPVQPTEASDAGTSPEEAQTTEKKPAPAAPKVPEAAKPPAPLE
jgi:nitrite reductase (cytochrome c-552)